MSRSGYGDPYLDMDSHIWIWVPISRYEIEYPDMESHIQIWQLISRSCHPYRDGQIRFQCGSHALPGDGGRESTQKHRKREHQIIIMVFVSSVSSCCCVPVDLTHTHAPQACHSSNRRSRFVAPWHAAAVVVRPLQNNSHMFWPYLLLYRRRQQSFVLQNNLTHSYPPF